MTAASYLIQSISIFLGIYTFILIARVLLTWFPQIDWYAQPFSTLSQLSDPYLNLFRSFLPPLGGIDFSAMLAIFALQFVGGLFRSAASQMMLTSLY
jgi:YggT family protein